MYLSLHVLLLVSTLTSLFCPSLHASSPALGADLATAVAQRQLGAPPLPNLDGGGVTVAPQYGYIEIDTSDSFYDSSSNHQMRFEGKSAGNTGGLSVSGSNEAGWGFFVFAVGSKIRGSSKTYQDDVHTYDINNVKASSVAGAAGLSYRLIGSESSVFALGFFGGPVAIKVTSSSEFQPDPSVGGGYAKYRFNPKFQGTMQGFQALLRLGGIRINPYLLFFNNVGDECQTIETEAESTYTGAPLTCNGQKDKLRTFGSFPAVGIFLGYKSFLFNAYSFTPISSLYKFTTYSGSLGITF